MAPQPERDPLTLRFRDAALERTFQAEAGAGLLPQLRLGLVVAIVLWAVAGVLLPRFAPLSRPTAAMVAGAMIVINAVGLALTARRATLDELQTIGVAVNTAAGLAVLALAYAGSAIDRYALPGLMLISVFAFIVLRLRFVAAFAAAAMYLAAFTAIVLLAEERSRFVIDLFILYSTTGAAATGSYFLEAANRDLFAQRERIAEQEQLIRAEKIKSDRLLRNILPEALASELREDARRAPVSVAAATVLFADLVGFTPLTERMPPEATAAMLNDIYSAFDDLTVRHGVEKIKTIGDSYMLVGGVPQACDDHAERVVATGLAMLEVVETYAARSATALALRVGVHSGPLVAGVIGKSKFSFDLWGDTVNTASRMESHGVAGAVQVSEATLALLGGRFDAEPRGDIELKGKGRTRAFLIRRRSEQTLRGEISPRA